MAEHDIAKKKHTTTNSQQPPQQFQWNIQPLYNTNRNAVTVFNPTLDNQDDIFECEMNGSLEKAFRKSC